MPSWWTMLLEATCRRWADLAPYGGRATCPLPKEPISHYKLPWSMSRTPKSISILGSQVCFRSTARDESTWIHGPTWKATRHDKCRTSIIHTLWHMGHASRRKREGPLVIERSGDLTREPIDLKLHPPPPCILLDLNRWSKVGSRLVGSKAKEEMSPGSLTWHHPSLYL